MNPQNVSGEALTKLPEGASVGSVSTSPKAFQGKTDWKRVADGIRTAKNNDPQRPLCHELTELTEVAREHGLTLTELEEAAGPDWPEVAADTNLARALANAVQIRRMRERGQIPPNYTSVTVCAGCGPVPMWPNSPEYVLACPWCFNRAAGRPIPTKEAG